MAGIWINQIEKRNAILEEGGIKEGIDAAASVGDDRLMRQAGMRSGNIVSCNTFE